MKEILRKLSKVNLVFQKNVNITNFDNTYKFLISQYLTLFVNMNVSVLECKPDWKYENKRVWGWMWTCVLTVNLSRGTNASITVNVLGMSAWVCVSGNFFCLIFKIITDKVAFFFVNYDKLGNWYLIVFRIQKIVGSLQQRRSFQFFSKKFRVGSLAVTILSP